MLIAFSKLWRRMPCPHRTKGGGYDEAVDEATDEAVDDPAVARTDLCAVGRGPSLGGLAGEGGRGGGGAAQ